MRNRFLLCEAMLTSAISYSSCFTSLLLLSLQLSSRLSHDDQDFCSSVSCHVHYSSLFVVRTSAIQLQYKNFFLVLQLYYSCFALVRTAAIQHFVLCYCSCIVVVLHLRLPFSGFLGYQLSKLLLCYGYGSYVYHLSVCLSDKPVVCVKTTELIVTVYR